LSDEKEVLDVVRKAYDFGRQGIYEKFSAIHASGYTRFSDLPPFRLQEREEALKLKESLLTQLIDFEYELINPKVAIHGDVALASFIMRYRGMAVNDYAFEGRIVDTLVRCTVILIREDGEWKIVHEHFSRIPEGFSPE